MQTAEDAHSLDGALSSFRDEVRERLEGMTKQDLVELGVNVAEAIDRVAATLVGMPQDMGLDPSIAFVYGIIVGWDDAAEMVARRHEWHSYTVRRMERYNAAVERLIK